MTLKLKSEEQNIVWLLMGGEIVIFGSFEQGIKTFIYQWIIVSGKRIFLLDILKPPKRHKIIENISLLRLTNLSSSSAMFVKIVLKFRMLRNSY